MGKFVQFSGGHEFYLRPFYLPNHDPTPEFVEFLLGKDDLGPNLTEEGAREEAIRRSELLFENDVRQMSQVANAKKIKDNVRDSFPYPYAGTWSNFVVVASGQSGVYIPYLHNMSTEADGRKFLLSIKRRYEDDVNKYWEQPSHFAIVSKFTNTVIGECTAQQMNNKCFDGVKLHDFELAYWLNPAYWGRGIATQTIALVVAYVFESYGYAQRIHAEMYYFNQKSAEVLEKVGFTKESHHRLPYLKGGKLVDSNVYGIIRKDYETLIHGRPTEPTASVSSETTDYKIEKNEHKIRAVLQRAREEILHPTSSLQPRSNKREYSREEGIGTSTVRPILIGIVCFSVLLGYSFFNERRVRS